MGFTRIAAALFLSVPTFALAGPMLPRRPATEPAPAPDPETAPATRPAPPPATTPTTLPAPAATRTATTPAPATPVTAATTPATISATTKTTTTAPAPAATTTATTTTAPATKTATTTTAPAATKSAATSTAPATLAATVPATKKAPLAKAAQNFSTPELTLKTFAEAIRLSDGEALQNCFSKPPADEPIAPVFLAAVINAVKLKRAAIDTYGDEVVQQFEMPDLTAALELGRFAALSNRLVKDRTSATLHIKKDSAPMILNADEFGQTWLIDPLTFVTVRAEQRKHPETFLPLIQSTAKVLEDTRNDILAGKYPKVSDASAAFHSNLTEATKKAVAATRAAAETKP